MKIVRLATRADLLPVVSRWVVEAFAEPGTPVDARVDALREMFSESAYPFSLVAIDDDGTPLGCVHGVESELDDRPELQPFIAALYVERPSRGRSVGSQLLAAAERECAAAGFSEAYLCAWNDQRWYERRGWQVIAARVGDRGVPLMRKALAPAK
jgi:N-acetylglutamate synthase-like GNAT family acetyltransferase